MLAATASTSWDLFSGLLPAAFFALFLAVFLVDFFAVFFVAMGISDKILLYVACGISAYALILAAFYLIPPSNIDYCLENTCKSGVCACD